MSEFGLSAGMTKTEAYEILNKYLDIRERESTYRNKDNFREARRYILRDFYDECKKLGIDMTHKRCECCGAWS
jgi:hypothetical protein